MGASTIVLSWIADFGLNPNPVISGFVGFIGFVDFILMGGQPILH